MLVESQIALPGRLRNVFYLAKQSKDDQSKQTARSVV